MATATAMRGIDVTRDVLLMDPCEIERAGLKAGLVARLIGDAGDSARRAVGGLTLEPIDDLPDVCVGSCYRQMRPLVPLWYHDTQSQTPGSIRVPVPIATTPTVTSTAAN